LGLHLDEMAVGSLDPRTPADERYDINAWLYAQLHSTLADGDAMASVEQNVAQLRADPLFFGGGGAVLPEGVIAKAALRLEPYSVQWSGNIRDVTGRGHQAILGLDEFGVVQMGAGSALSRWVEKPIAGGFEFLRSVVDSVDFLKAVMLTRQRQVLQCCKPATDQDPLGFIWLRKDGEKLEDEDKRETAKLTELILRSGDETDARENKKMRRPEMQEFISRLVWDTLSADACPIETEMSRSGKKLAGLYNIPYDTIRLCTELGYEGDDAFTAVQVLMGTPHVAFTYDDIIYEVRNPRTDLHVNGYGYAEPEMVMRATTAYINSFTFNASALDSNSIPRGILTLHGEYDRRELNAFRNNLRAMLHGAGSRFQLPVMASKTKEGGAIWTPMDQFNEMFFAKWFSLLVSIICAVYSIHPTELNFDSFSHQTSSTLGGSDTEEKLKHSRDKGLLPLLNFVQRIYNRFIVPFWTKKYELQFTGLHQEDPKEKQERVKLYSTVDELRDGDGKPPLEDPLLGEAPTNPALMQAYMMGVQQKMMAEQQAAGGGVEGDEDYPQDEDGQHDPWQGGEPDEDSFHTLRMGGGGNGNGTPPAPGGSARRATPPTGNGATKRGAQAMAKAALPWTAKSKPARRPPFTVRITP